MLQTALLTISADSGAKYEDKIEAYQWLSDNWELDRLNESQQAEFQQMVESGLILTAPWRPEL